MSITRNNLNYNKYLLYEKARSVSLLRFMEDTYPELLIKEGKKCGRYSENKSIVIKHDGYYDNNAAVLPHRSSIDFLINFLGMEKNQAVTLLCDYADGLIDEDCLPKRDLWDAASVNEQSREKTFSPPRVSDNDGDIYTVERYLLSRGLPFTAEMREVVHAAKSNGYVNVMFSSRDCNYGELRGTNIYGNPFKGKFRGSDADGYFIVGEKQPDTIYICEAAIDALSLQRLYDFEYGSAFASIGGVNCKAAIDRIHRTYPDAKIIIAFDNDAAGNKAAENLPYDRHAPVRKDWNEDLVSCNGAEIRKRLNPFRNIGR